LLSNLTYLSLYSNHLTGTWPDSITNLTRLEHLDLSDNNLTGKIPFWFANLTRLEHLDLSNNYITGVSFANLTRLKYVYLSNNNLTGILPTQVVSLKNLYYLYLSRNNFIGQIPSSFGSMVNLTYLDLSANQLNGSIPPALITNLHKLETLDLSNNNLDGPIPSSFGSLSQLQSLNLSMNSISGPIPLDIANLMNLGHLDLHDNRLVGAIHPEFGKLVNLSYLDLSSNQLSGNMSFGKPCFLVHLDLSQNMMTGDITSLRGCRNLNYLDISGNHLVIAKALTYYDLPNIDFLNLSQNLTNGLSETNEHKRRKQHVPRLTIFLPIIVGLCFLVVAYFFYSRKKATTKKLQPEITKHGDVCTIMNYDGTIAYEDFINATEDFDLKYCIGTGGYGSVYEAKLRNGQTFALKKLHRYEAKQPTFNQSFKNEVQVLTNLRHKNIVRLYGFCLHNKCNFLIYEYMEKREPILCIRDDELAVEVDWMKRVNIIKDVANALAYMHHDCNPPIVHRDISSNNILLNSEMEGFVADFGAARLLDPDSSNQTVIAGTLGYIAPGSYFYTLLCFLSSLTCIVACSS